MAKQSSIFDLALRLVPYLLGYKQQQQKPTVVIDSRDAALLNLRNKKGSVTVVLGSRDTGKTELCYRLAEFLNRPTFAVSPQQKPPEWITWVKKLDDMFTMVPRNSTLLCDDLPSYASNRDYNEALVRALERTIPMVRHEPNPPDFPLGEVHLIFSSQSSAQADKYILDADAAFFKPLGLLYEDFERPNIRRIYRNYVDPVFEGKDDAWIVRHAFMWTRTYRGVIKFEKTS